MQCITYSVEKSGYFSMNVGQERETAAALSKCGSRNVRND